MSTRWLLSGSMVAAALLLVAGVVVTPRMATAQDMTASPVIGMASHPAHIHMGTCETLGEVMFPLVDVASVDPMAAESADQTGSPEAGEDLFTDEMAATPTNERDTEGIVVAQSQSTVDAPLDDILAAEHAINVHESAENIQNYIACGDISGTPADGSLEITLNELDDSGYEGRATLTDNGDGTTTVVVELGLVQDDMDGVATPAA